MNSSEFNKIAIELLKENLVYISLPRWIKKTYFLFCNINSNVFVFFTGIIVSIPVTLFINFFSSIIDSYIYGLFLFLSFICSTILTYFLIKLTIYAIKTENEFLKDSPTERKLNTTFGLLIENINDIKLSIKIIFISFFLFLLTLVFSFLVLNGLLNV